MKKSQLQLLATGLILLTQPALSQNVKLANVALGMNEADVKAALASSAPYYVNQVSDSPDLYYLVAEAEAESFAFTFIDGRVAAFSLMHILPPGPTAVSAPRPGAYPEHTAQPCDQANLGTR